MVWSPKSRRFTATGRFWFTHTYSKALLQKKIVIGVKKMLNASLQMSNCSVGNAYEKLCGQEYGRMGLSIFEMSDCLMTADGSDDHLIKPENPVDYSPPPVEFCDATRALLASNEFNLGVHDGETEVNVNDNVEFDEDASSQEITFELSEKDRLFY